MSRRGWRSLATLLCALGISLFCLSAQAAKLRTEVSARQVGIGERVVVQVTAVQEDGDETPSQPTLKVSGPAEVQGPDIRTQHSARMVNFSFTRERSVVATWAVTPTAAGQLTIGPATFLVGKQRLISETIVVTVTNAPSAQAPSPRGRFDPFSIDPFFTQPLRQPAPPRDFGLPEAPEKLQVEKAPHPIAFLRAIPSKRKLVVGEPVRVEIYGYASRGPFRELSPTEPSTAQFLSFSVVEHSQEEPPYITTIEGERWLLVKLRELILVPLEVGTLEVGSMEAIFQGAGYPAQGSRYGTTVKSPPLRLKVEEPPLDGRPDGYLLGDVGRYGLDVQLSSRELVAGDYLQLVITIKGSGNVPSRVQLPSLPGVEWQEPTLSGGPTVKDGALGGQRTLKIAARVTHPGELMLGEITLPYYEPGVHGYRVAQADLGKITVRGAPVSAASSPTSRAAAAAGKQPALPLAARRTLALQSAVPLQPRPWHWYTLGLAPLTALLLGLGAALFKRLRAPRAPRQSRKKVVRSALARAEGHARAGERDGVLLELERAIYEAVEQTTGLRGRGLLRSQLGTALRERGVEEGLGQELGALVIELEARRYDSEGLDLKGLVAQTKKLLTRLQKRPRSGSRVTVVATLLALLVTWPEVAQAATQAPAPSFERKAFQEALAALDAGEPTRAVDLLESLADQGTQGADLAFNRGVAYLRRAESVSAKPGDWGQAAAAFHEALALQPGASDAQRGLEEAQKRVTERSSRVRGAEEVDTEPLATRLLELLSPSIVFLIAALGSLLATGGLLLRTLGRASTRTAATIALVIGLLILLPAMLTQQLRQRFLSQARPAVIVTERATLFDAAGRPLRSRATLPEGRYVLIHETAGRLSRIATSQDDVWVSTSALRPVPHAQRF